MKLYAMDKLPLNENGDILTGQQKLISTMKRRMNF